MSNPVPSDKISDGKLNFGTADVMVNSDDHTVTTRTGKVIRTFAGINAEFDAAQAGQFVAASQDAADRAETAAEVAAAAGRVYEASGDGQADSELVDGDYFWVVSAEDSEVLELWRKGASSPTDTGKRTVSKEYSFSKYKGLEKAKERLTARSFVDGQVSRVTYSSSSGNPTAFLPQVFDGVLSFARPTSNSPIVIPVGFNYTGGSAHVVSKWKFVDIDGISTGPYIAIGADDSNPQGVILVGVLSNGTFAITTNTGSGIQTISSGFSIQTGDEVTYDVFIVNNGAICISVKNETTGQQSSFGFEGLSIPSGNIWLCDRRGGSIEVSEFFTRDLTVSGTELKRMFGPARISDPSLIEDVEFNVNSDGFDYGKYSNQQVFFDLGLPTSPPFYASCEYSVRDNNNANIERVGFLINNNQGDPLRSYNALANGFLGEWFGASNQRVIESSDMEFSDGDIIKVELFIDVDRSGYIRATKNGEFSQQLDLENIPQGTISLHTRYFVGSVSALNILNLNPHTQREITELKNNPALSQSLAFETYTNLPDRPGGAPSGGFTCTGLDRITRGIWAGCWLVGNDGRDVDSGGSGIFKPEVVVLTPDFKTIIHVFEFDYNASLQGVAVDTSGSEDTFWIATSAEGFIRHVHLYGPNQGEFIDGDEFDWTDAGFEPNPNGLAYDPVNDALWACSSTASRYYLIATDPSASPRVLQSYEGLGVRCDMLHYRPEEGILYGTVGANGEDGRVVGIDVSDGSVTDPFYGPLKFAQAIEGIYIDRDTASLYITSDGGFHLAARPQFNIALKYKIPLMG